MLQKTKRFFNDAAYQLKLYKHMRSYANSEFHNFMIVVEVSGSQSWRSTFLMYCLRTVCFALRAYSPRVIYVDQEAVADRMIRHNIDLAVVLTDNIDMSPLSLTSQARVEDHKVEQDLIIGYQSVRLISDYTIGSIYSLEDKITRRILRRASKGEDARETARDILTLFEELEIPIEKQL